MKLNNQILKQLNKKALDDLERDAKLLEEIAKDIWLLYYDTYDTQVYDRSIHGYGRDAVNAIDLLPKIEFIGDKARMTVTFEDEYALHPSIFKGGEDGNVFTLIDRGWTAEKLENRFGRRIEHFTHYDGYDYFNKVIEEFNRRKKSNTMVKHVSKRSRGRSESDEEFE